MNNLMKNAVLRAVVFIVSFCGSNIAWAAAPSMSIGYQPMVSDGLAANQPFEAWLWLDKSSDPTIPGYAVPAGATLKLRFTEQFSPEPGHPLYAVMLNGWTQGAIPAKFTVSPDQSGPRTISIHYNQGIVPGGVEKPGLKAIHLHTGLLNPATAGDYPITVEFSNAGSLTGTNTAVVVHITQTAVPNVASYNQLHQGLNEDWQHVQRGKETPLPIDFLVNLPNNSRSFISLQSAKAGGLDILGDGKKIGSISVHGVPLSLAPEAFGPGFARLGIVRLHAKAGETQGIAEIVASLDGGTQYKIHVVVE